MRDNNDLTIMREIHNIEYAKSKYFFIGLMISLIPYIFILLVANKLGVANSFIYMILIITILSCVINGIIVSKNVYKKLIDFFENKYDIDYLQAKKEL